MSTKARHFSLGKAYHAQQGNLLSRRAIVEQPLIQYCKEGVQYSAVGLEDLIYEGHISFGQVPFCLPDILVVF